MVITAATVLFLVNEALHDIKSGLQSRVSNADTWEFHTLLFMVAIVWVSGHNLIVIEGMYRLGAAQPQLTRRLLDHAKKLSMLEALSAFPPLIIFLPLGALYHVTPWEWIFIGVGYAFVSSEIYTCLEMRRMLLHIEGMECAHRTRSILLHGRVVIASQIVVCLLFQSNTGQANIIKRLNNHGYNATVRNANMTTACTEFDSSDATGYQKCICGGFTSEYLSANCSIATGVEIDINLVRGYFAHYDCPREAEWDPYKNQWEACKSYTLLADYEYLKITSLGILAALPFLWVYFEYAALQSAEDLRLGRPSDAGLYMATTIIARFSFAMIGFLALFFVVLQLTYSSLWLKDRDDHVSAVGHNGGLVLVGGVLFLVGGLAIIINTLARKVSNTYRNNFGQYDCFLTHDWGIDELKRKTHDRVSRVNAMLKARGFITWFDEERMEGNINQQMARGVDYSRAVIVFVTERYMQKVGGEGDRGDDDNWYAAWDGSTSQPPCFNSRLMPPRLSRSLSVCVAVNLSSSMRYSVAASAR